MGESTAARLHVGRTVEPERACLTSEAARRKMSSINKKHVNVERRTWDKETYEARARSRASVEESGDDHKPKAAAARADGPSSLLKDELEPEEEKEEFAKADEGRVGPMGSERAFLKARSKRVDLESKVGSSEIIDPDAASATRAKVDKKDGVSKCSDGVGWYCKVCDCFLKDSLTYLDHINGRKHQRKLGYTMRVQKSTTDEVSGVLQGLAKSKRDRENDPDKEMMEPVDFEEMIRNKDAKAAARKAERARRREERKRKERGEIPDVPKPAPPPPPEVNDGSEEEEYEEGGIDPALAVMMGISGFGSSKK